MDKGCLITAALMAALSLTGAGCILLAIRSLDDKAPPALQENQAVAQKAISVEQIPWQEIDAIYRIAPNPEASNSAPDSQWPALERKIDTDLKKEASWAKYKNRFVEWEGTLVDVRLGTGRATLGIKMNDSTATQKDIILSLKATKIENAKAKQLTTGDRLRFRGRLRNWGSTVQFAMDQGEILE